MHNCQSNKEEKAQQQHFVPVQDPFSIIKQAGTAQSYDRLNDQSPHPDQLWGLPTLCIRGVLSSVFMG